MGELEGKLAVVTGGGAGIGLAIAERFADDGAKLVLVGRRKDLLDEAAYFLATCDYMTGQVIDVDGGWTAG
jgi:NAD(P)-dependent dehydrogenase (short-subunit alcohol dehydrogenase family)